jgi:hypothetical protein
LLAGERIPFLRRGQTSLEPTFLDLVVLLGVIPRLALAFVLAILLPLAVAPVPVALVPATGPAGRSSPGHFDLSLGRRH